MAEPHDEAVRQRALRDWSVDRYAEFDAPIRSQIPHGFAGTGDSRCIFQLEPWPGDILFGGRPKGDAVKNMARVNLRTEEVKWSEENRATDGFDYDPLNDRVIYGSDDEIRIRDVATGDLVKTITSYPNLGIDVGHLWGASFDKNDKSYAWIADSGQSRAGRLNLETGDLTPYLDTEVTNPLDISHRGDDSKVLVADRDVERVIQVDFTASPPSVDWYWLYPSPVGVKHQWYPDWNPPRLSAVGVVTSGGVQPFAYVVSGLDYNARYSMLMGALAQYAQNIATFDLHDPRYVWITGATSSIRARWERELPGEHGRWNYHGRRTETVTRDIAANDSYEIESPMVGLHHEKMMVRVHSTQDATGVIEVPDMQGRLCWVDPDYSWVDQASFSITGGESEKYVMSAPPSLWKLRVDMGSTAGTVNMQIQGW